MEKKKAEKTAENSDKSPHPNKVHVVQKNRRDPKVCMPNCHKRDKEAESERKEN